MARDALGVSRSAKPVKGFDSPTCLQSVIPTPREKRIKVAGEWVSMLCGTSQWIPALHIYQILLQERADLLAAERKIERQRVQLAERGKELAALKKAINKGGDPKPATQE